MPATFDPADIPAQLDQATAAFREAYAKEPTHAVSAPGRVNLIGEHTDYNDGFVLPLAIERQSVLVAAARNDTTVNLRSTALPGQATLDLARPIGKGEPSWANYLVGVITRWAQDYELPHGFDAILDSTVPGGGGLSSSASIEVAMARLLEAITGHRLEPKERALMAQWSEHHYAGMPCGVMDQFASSLGRADHALLIDCRSQEVTEVPLPPELAVLIINSNKKHELVGGKYAQRQAQCQAAAQALGVPSLRDAGRGMLETARAKLDEVTYRRARHVITENQRTLTAVEALERGDWPTVGRCMYESHDSMRDDFEITTPELDLLVEAAAAIGPEEGVIGSRMTGGGFGGCTVSLVKADAVDEVARRITEAYKEATGIDAAAFTTKAAGGARELAL